MCESVCERECGECAECECVRVSEGRRVNVSGYVKSECECERTYERGWLCV